MVFFGFGGVFGEEEKGLVAALSEKVSASEAKLDGQAIGNACYGLQKMTAASEEEKGLLAALSEKVSTPEAKLNAQKEAYEQLLLKQEFA